MDLVLVGITTISLLLAVGMGVVLFRISREDRLRSEARVALIARAAADAEASLARTDSPEPPVASWIPDGTPDLFVERDTPAPWRARLAVAGGVGVLIAAVALASGSGDAPAETAAALAPAPAPLELLTLRHTLEADGLVVSGVVHNPRKGAPLSGISATALIFGADGALLATGLAGLDFVELAPGAESAFVIKVPVAGTVSRYRIGFRRHDGAVVPHVDRREDRASGRRPMPAGAGAVAGTSVLPGSVPWLR